jgi:PHP family Zn ribbon phosphoesterase
MPEEKREEAAYVHDIHGHMIPYVRIDPDICDNALKVEDHTNVFPEGQEFAAVAWSVRGITHESMHVWKNEHNESITDCYAVQRVGAMTLALGASQEVADQITSRVVILQPQLVTREYQVPGACHDGGTLDLDPAMQTAFPVPIPK